MDEATGNLIAATGLDEGLGMFTVKLDVGYKRPVFVGEPSISSGSDVEKELGTGTSVIVATAKLGKTDGRKVFVEAVIRNADGEVCTTADAIFVKKRPAAGVL